MRLVLAFMLLLLPALGAHAQASDPAYVDSPENKAAPDPARTDGIARGGSSAAGAAQSRYDEEAHAELTNAQAQEQAMAQMQQITAMQVAAFQRAQQTPANSGYADPPIGGNSLLRQMDPGRFEDPMPTQAPRASAGRQLGGALLQDAAGLVDARIRREVQPNGPVYLPAGTTSPPPPGF